MQSVSVIERQTMAKVYLRLLPFCFVLYFICYLDRVNIGFAALTMNKELGLSSYVFGLGAGAFFWGYFLLEVPSNLILEKVGARRWIGRIMISCVGRLRLHPGAGQLHHPAVHLGARRGRFLPRHDSLFHLLVPATASRAHRRRLYGSNSGVDRARCTGFDRVPRTRWLPWTSRLEMAVPWRGSPGGRLRSDLLLLPNRSAGRGEVARGRLEDPA
jgi:hypothetical protein